MLAALKDDENFFDKNVEKTNELFAKMLLVSNIIGPLLAFATSKELFNISYSFAIIASAMCFVFTLLQFITQKKCKNQYYVMYQGLTITSIFVSFLGSNHKVGIYISYALVPFLSCLYFNKKATIYSCIFGFLCMLASLWGKAQVLYIRSQMSGPFEWWLPMSAGFTIEFFFVCLFTYSLAGQFRLTLERTEEKNRKISRLQISLIQSFANIVEWSDQFTGEHIKRTSKYVELISHKLRDMKQYSDILTDEEIDLYVSAAPLHDIGKINVPNNILSKPGKFTPDEYEQMKTHARTGYEIITNELIELEDTDYIKAAGEMALYHHERWDGTGYPNQIAGLTIPLCARIMAAADVLDALLSKRQYKEAFSIDEAMEYFESAKGKHFEPCIAEAVLSLRDKVEQISATNITD